MQRKNSGCVKNFSNFMMTQGFPKDKNILDLKYEDGRPCRKLANECKKG